MEQEGLSILNPLRNFEVDPEDVSPFLISICVVVGLFLLKVLLRRFIKWRIGAEGTPVNKVWHLTWISIILGLGSVGLFISLNAHQTSSGPPPIPIRIASCFTISVYLIVFKSLLGRLLKDHLIGLDLDPKFMNKIWHFTWVIVILLFGIISLTASLNILSAAAAAAAAIVGFSLQTPLKTIVGGLMIVTGKNFEKGDCVKIGDIKGEVVEIKPMSIILKEANGTESGTVHIPNSMLFDQMIINYTRLPPEETPV